MDQPTDSKTAKNVPTKNHYNSETRESFAWKYANATDRTDLAAKSNRVNYIKNYSEHINTIPHRINEYQTIYRNDYKNTRPTFEEVPSFIHSTVKRVKPDNCKNHKLNLAANKQGYAKYMDMLATTNMLTYVPFTLEQKEGVACGDNVTIWNWVGEHKANPYLNKPKVKKISNVSLQTNKYTARNIPLAHKAVPNFGQCSESKDKFKTPSSSIKFNSDFINLQAKVMPPTVHETYTTEASIYGSGKRTDEFIKAK